jgi:hypothetical protein
MSELTDKLSRLKSIVTNQGCSLEDIDRFEAIYGLLNKEYREFLLWSNGVEFDNYSLEIPMYAEYKERIDVEDKSIPLHFSHLASLEAVQECIDYANAEIRDLTTYDLNSEDYFINNLHPIAYDIFGRDYVCLSKLEVDKGVYVVNWWEPGSYRFMPFPQVKITNSLLSLVNILLANGPAD